MTGVSGLGSPSTIIQPQVGARSVPQSAAEDAPQLPAYLLIGLSPQTGGSAPAIGRFGPGDTSALIAAVTLALDQLATGSRNDAIEAQAQQAKGALGIAQGLRNAIIRAEAERDVAQAELAQAQESRAAKASQRDDLRRISEGLGTRIAGLDAILARPNPPAGAQAERDALAAQKQGVDGQIGTLDQEIAQLDQRIDAAQGRIATAQGQVDSARTALVGAFALILSAIAALNGANGRTNAAYDSRERSVSDQLDVNDEIVLQLDSDTQLRELDKEWRADSDQRDQAQERLTRVAAALVAGVLDIRVTLSELLSELAAGQQDDGQGRVRLAL
jgi:chromosome segregation ATPase